MKRNPIMKKFSEDETRFSKPIKKIKIANFAISKFEKKKKHKRNHKLQAFKAQEIGFFGRVLHLSVVSGMYLEKIFEYYILPESPCFTHTGRKCSDTPLYGQRSKFLITKQCRKCCYRHNDFTKI